RIRAHFVVQVRSQPVTREAYITKRPTRDRVFYAEVGIVDQPGILAVLHLFVVARVVTFETELVSPRSIAHPQGEGRRVRTIIIMNPWQRLLLELTAFVRHRHVNLVVVGGRVYEPPSSHEQSGLPVAVAGVGRQSMGFERPDLVRR